MNVFGLEEIQSTIVVIITGVLLQVRLGYIQSGNIFDGKKLLAFAIIVLVVSFTIVATVI